MLKSPLFQYDVFKDGSQLILEPLPVKAVVATFSCKRIPVVLLASTSTFRKNNGKGANEPAPPTGGGSYYDLYRPRIESSRNEGHLHPECWSTLGILSLVKPSGVPQPTKKTKAPPDESGEAGS